ncbi:MAG: RNA pyrophosphohydrolase [Rhodospirillales bacterium]|nr:RNA pyrophosphohydrolase [Alphaproteobacteria bacterium]MCB9987388.1 RNA pyrophosphohydrolase [Rhodospirillales bacterium]USO07630.1 MAG: RNA pyrophosphohydrolase [Rhodospirillales bacterium]
MKTIEELRALPYRQSVGIVLFNPDGLVFVGERLDHPGAWQMPQGGIDAGETIEQAAIRELREETGTDKAEVVHVSDTVLTYDLPDHLLGKLWSGRYKGQEQRWAALRFLGQDHEITLYDKVHPEFSNWKWVPLAQVCELIVPFKRATYEEVIREFTPVLERNL